MYVLARNSKGRPMLQHKIGSDTDYTACGYYLVGWSREYTPIKLTILLCKKCEKL